MLNSMDIPFWFTQFTVCVLLSSFVQSQYPPPSYGGAPGYGAPQYGGGSPPYGGGDYNNNYPNYINSSDLISYIVNVVSSNYLPINFTDTNLSANFTANYTVPYYGSYGYNQQPGYGGSLYGGGAQYGAPPYGGGGGYGAPQYAAASPYQAAPFLGGALPNVPYAVTTIYGQPTVYGNGPAGYGGGGYGGGGYGGGGYG